MRNTKIFCGLALAVASSITVTARANMLVNGGLEVTAGQLTSDPSLMYADGLIHASQSTHSNVLTGWTIGGASIDVVPNTYWQSTQGSYSVDLIGTTGIGSITQTVSGLTPGNLYELSFDFTVNPGDGWHGGESAFIKWLDVGITDSSIPEWCFSGMPSGTQTAIDMGYVRRAIDFTATSTSTTVTLQALFPSGLPATFTDGAPVRTDSLYTGPVVDNVDLQDITPLGGNGKSTPVPEPASLAALSIGGLMLLRRRR